MCRFLDFQYCLLVYIIDLDSKEPGVTGAPLLDFNIVACLYIILSG